MLRSSTSTAALLLFRLACAQAGPVFHWPLDESSGTVAQPVAGNSPGILSGGVLWDPLGGHHQGAARFDGVDDRILLGPCDLTNGGGALTLSVWVKPDFVTAMERTLIAKTTGPQPADHHWSLSFVNASAVRFRLNAGGTTTELSTSPSSIFSGTWYHIVASYDGAQMRIHVNGALMAATPKTGAIGMAPQSPASLGARSTGAAPFSGWLDDARIYARALSDQEIIGLLFETLTTGIPNAARSTLSINNGALSLPTGIWEHLRLYSISGALLAEQRLQSGSNAVYLDTPSAGLFLVCLTGRGTTWSGKLWAP
ncbi:MAG: LamG domain-containing protein [Flavobacteriales bacterium]|nr:LamG domain-containing protein [Flavobacteriales bacterium]